MDLQRFVDAQASVYDEALEELRRGRKRSHWMWFVFPQVQGLGFSAMAQRYAIASRAEALAYLHHPLLGARLVECVEAMLAVDGKSLLEILGRPDDLKFRSSMTLFATVAVASDDPADRTRAALFEQALQRYCHGEADPRTLERL